MKIGILFGGPSREREIAFAGGRTVYDNLNKALFEPVPIFIDSLGNYILLDWQYIYKGSIRDFYPPVSALPDSPNHFQVYMESLGELSFEQVETIANEVGQLIQPQQLTKHIDFAFLALHGRYGEDGEIQTLLEDLGIPYSGSGVEPSQIGIDKARQKQVFEANDLATPDYLLIPREEWVGRPDELNAHWLRNAQQKLGNKLVVKAANQGSSIGISILMDSDYPAFKQAMDAAFFVKEITADDWQQLNNTAAQVSYVRTLTDIREGIGLPVQVGEQVIYHPEELLNYLQTHFADSDVPILLQALDDEREVLLEAFVAGKEFSCIVVRNEDDKPVSLPPTEIVKGKEVFDYRSKYLPGLSRKITPIELPNEHIEQIREACEGLFDTLGCHVYARIDGFIQADGKLYLNDPNTTSGMLPSSFFFHQAAEIGLNPSQFLSYIIRTSLKERLAVPSLKETSERLLTQLDKGLKELQTAGDKKKKIAVILGGFSSERHISVESGRNIYEKLASSSRYEPVPVFLTGNEEEHLLYQIPINVLLKDNADDIKEKINHFAVHPVVENIKKECQPITDRYVTQTATFEPIPLSYEDLAGQVDGAFIALHGRPGEDGAVQRRLDRLRLPYNGSSADTSQLTINKFETNKLLRAYGFETAAQMLLYKSDWLENEQKAVDSVLTQYTLPIIAKPVDDGCSSAVKKIESREELEAFLRLLFREQEDLMPAEAAILHLKPKEEFPNKEVVLIESFIDRGDAKYFLEITGGLLTHWDTYGNKTIEVFEPSEALAGGSILSLEEKFLAGEGQNITPARFGNTPVEYELIASKVKQDLQRVAELLNIDGYSRIDAFVRVQHNMEVQTIIIEVNSLPGMTPATCIFHQAAINGYKPFDFINEILAYSFKRHQFETAP